MPSPRSALSRIEIIKVRAGRIARRWGGRDTTDLAGAKTETAVDGDWRRLLAEHFGIA
jgi:hypothetical protein